MNNKKHFCYEIFKNLSITSLNNKLAYSPCSWYEGYFDQSDQLNVHQAWNSTERHKIIELVNQDQPVPGCRRCYFDEEHGIKSRRQSAFELYEQFHQNTTIDLDGPQGLDYSVGNLCNLKCIICGPQSSTQWFTEFQQLYPTIDISRYKYQKNNQLEINNNNSLDNVISIHFHGGGEPLMSQSHANLLRRIDQVKGLADVRIFYNTNGTVTVSDDILQLWEKCRLVELYFSIDAVGQRFDYQRTGANFEKVAKNLQWFYHNMPSNYMFNINAVWGYINLYYLNELVDWQQANFTANRYGDPAQLIFQKANGPSEINHVNQQTYDILLKRFENYPTLTQLVKSLQVNNRSHCDFLNWIQQIDAIRNQKFHTIMPEWAKLLGSSS